MLLLSTIDYKRHLMLRQKVVPHLWKRKKHRCNPLKRKHKSESASQKAMFLQVTNVNKPQEHVELQYNED